MARTLTLTSPYLRGPDVKRVQRAAVTRLTRKGITAELKVDGEYGPRTHQIVLRAADALGVHPTAGSTAAARRRVAVILHPSLRTPAERARSRKRRKARERAGTGLSGALKWARGKIGVHEVPAGSNKGPQITQWQAEVGLPGGGYPWCGAFAAAVARVFGIVLTGDTRYCPAIVAHARAGTGGYLRWTTSPAEAAASLAEGRLVLTVFDFQGPEPKHVGVLAKIEPGDQVRNIEGNTSSGSAGSQDNGGQVAERVRPLRDVTGFAICRKPATAS